MDHLRIIRRAFSITRFYPALWVFGILIALTASRGGGNGGGGGGGGGGTGATIPFTTPGQGFSFPPNIGNILIAVGIGLACFFIILAVIFTFLRYISITSLVRMVDLYESSGEKVTVGQGFRLGWTRASFRNWLLDLLIFVVGFIATVLLILLIAAPLLLWLTHNNTLGIIGTVITVGLLFLFILALIVVVAALSILLELAHRAIVLEGLGVFAGLSRGWEILRSRPGDAVIMGLLLFGIGLVYGILMIPVFFLALLVGLVAGGLPALLVGALTNIFIHGHVPQIAALIVGIPILLFVLVVPLTFFGGLFETYKSSAWTLTFREMLALGSLRPKPEAPLEPPATEEAPPIEPTAPHEPEI